MYTDHERDASHSNISQGMNGGTVAVIALLTFLLGGVLGGICGFLAGSFYGLFDDLMPKDLSHMDVAVDSPESVKVGEAFEIEIAIRNNGLETTTLDSIDVYAPYLEGIEITGSTPAASRIDRDNDVVTLWYQKGLEAGADMHVTLHARPRKVGRFEGELDVCIGNSVSFITHTMDTTVTD